MRDARSPVLTGARVTACPSHALAPDAGERSTILLRRRRSARTTSACCPATPFAVVRVPRPRNDVMGQLAQTLEQFLGTYGYVAVFVLMFVEEAGVPMPLPNEVALMYVGYLAYQGRLDANIAAAVATAGAAGGSGLLYLLAVRGGRPLIRKYGRFLHINDSKLDKAEAWIKRFGMISVPVARLTPGLRIYTTVVAGVLHVPFKVVFAAVVGASSIWSFFWVHLGLALGDNWQTGARSFERAGRWGVIVVVALIAIALLGRWLYQRRAKRAGLAIAPSTEMAEPPPTT